MALHGRLLKDSGRAASGDTRRAFYRDAADAYARAGGLTEQTYPLINAATLSLLAGERDRSRVEVAAVVELSADQHRVVGAAAGLGHQDAGLKAQLVEHGTDHLGGAAE